MSTNRWGMRDKDYTKEKPDHTLRIAMVGPSLLMGSGVSDGETFESLTEERMNRGFKLSDFDKVEMLNFGVEGHTFPEQLAMLENRVFDFRPDIAIGMIYYPTRAWTERYVRKIVWNDVPISDPELRELLTGTGLGENRGAFAVPFPAGRQLARWAGFSVRMPSAESEAKIRRVTDSVVEWSIRRFARVTRERGVVPLILGLNAVIDDAPAAMPHLATIRAAGLPTIDLFDIYPPAERVALRVAEYDEHPNATGQKLIAGRLYEELDRFLKSGALEKR